MRRIKRQAIFSFSIAALLSASLSTNADEITFETSGTLSTVDDSALGFPTILAGTMPGDPFSVRLTFDTDAPVGPLPFVGGDPFFDEAGTFSLIDARVIVNGTEFSNFSGDLFGLVTNDYTPTGLSSLRDGLGFLNVPGPGETVFDLTNAGLSASTFSDETPPDSDLPILMTLRMRQQGSGQFWLNGNTNSGLNVIPEPAAATILGLSLLMLTNGRRRREQEG